MTCNADRKINHVILLLLILLMNTGFAASGKTKTTNKRPLPLHTQHPKKIAVTQLKKPMQRKTLLTAITLPAQPPKVILLKNNPARGMALSQDKPLVKLVEDMVSTLQYSAYKLGGTHFDTSRGVYIVDCSSYVDHLLKKAYPQSFSKLVRWSRSATPTTQDFYHFFTKLSPESKRYWNTIEDVKKLKAGDILVFRKKENPNASTGHIMIVMDNPIRDKNMFLLRITDSAPFRHSQDTRSFNVSGIGIGTMLLRINPKTSQPSAYAWTIGSRWKKNVVFAMARPVEIKQ